MCIDVSKGISENRIFVGQNGKQIVVRINGMVLFGDDIQCPGFNDRLSGREHKGGAHNFMV